MARRLFLLSTFSILSSASVLIKNEDPTFYLEGDEPKDVFKEFLSPYVSFVDDVFNRLKAEEHVHTGNISDQCHMETKIVMDLAMKENSDAMKFIDASGMPPSGFLVGAVNSLGSYSECLNAQVAMRISTNRTYKRITGKYCLASLDFTKSTNDSVMLPQASWTVLAKSTQKPSVALCVPSSCTSEDVHMAVASSVTDFFHQEILVTPLCHEEHDFSHDTLAIGIAVVFLLFIVIAFVSTVYDIIRNCRRGCCQKTTESTEVLYDKQQNLTSCSRADAYIVTFSLTRNAAKILKVDNEKEGSIAVLHGLKFLSMVLIIFGHTFSFAQQDLFFRNLGTMLQAPKQPASQFAANGTLAVDTFYFVSGLLVTYVALKAMGKKDGKLPYISFVIHRYIRLTPLLLFVIAFCTSLLRYMGSGPNYLFSIQMYDSWCRKNWWTNVLYLQNFINTEHMCLGHTWYLATDMQFYILTPLILKPLYKHFRYGAMMLAVFFVSTVTVTIVLTAINHYPAIPYMNNELPLELVNSYYKHVYIKPYCRMGPYLIGILAGYLITKKKEFHLKQIHVAVSWLACVLLMLFVIFIMYGANNGAIPPIAAAAAYSGLARSVWTLGIAWITLACYYGYGGFVNTLLSWSPLVVGSRLTYCAYLIHPVIMGVYYGSMKTTVDFSYSFLVYLFVGNAVCTYVIAFIFSLLFESPFIGLERVIMNRKPASPAT